MTIFETEAREVRLTENDVQTPGDGGRVVLVAQSKALKKATGADLVTVIFNYSDDEDMQKWPYMKEDRINRRFKLLVVEEEEG